MRVSQPAAEVPVPREVYGDGSLGDATIAVSETLNGDRYYENLTIDAGVTVTTAGFLLFVRGVLQNNGTISNPGAPGDPAAVTVGGSPGAAAAGH